MFFLELLGALLGGAGCLLMQAHRRQSTPYMDEVFHVPQAQRYCAGRLTEWDPKITTLPGLYLVAAGLLRLATWTTGAATGASNGTFAADAETLCTLFNLRLLNVGFLGATALLGYLVYVELHGARCHTDRGCSPGLLALHAVTIALLPTSCFFALLFYTDVGALATVLLLLWCHLRGFRVAASAAAALAVLFRQTNVVWVGFCALQTVERSLYCAIKAPAVVAARSAGKVAENLTPLEVLRWGLSAPAAAVRLLLVCAAECAGLLAVGALFAAFVAWNGAVVVGDRAAHVMVPHLAQLLYLAGFSALFAFPAALPNAASCRELLCALRRRPLRCLVLFGLGCALCAAAAHWGTVEHPYLLADNRHFTFYVWRRVLGRHWAVRYALAPVYVLAGAAVWRAVGAGGRSSVWRCAWLAAAAAALVPAGLLEPRYFTVPYVMWRLHVPPNGYWRALLELALALLVNGAAVYLFFNYTFRWPDAPTEVQRLMW